MEKHIIRFGVNGHFLGIYRQGAVGGFDGTAHGTILIGAARLGHIKATAINSHRPCLDAATVKGGDMHHSTFNRQCIYTIAHLPSICRRGCNSVVSRNITVSIRTSYSNVAGIGNAHIGAINPRFTVLEYDVSGTSDGAPVLLVGNAITGLYPEVGLGAVQVAAVQAQAVVLACDQQRAIARNIKSLHIYCKRLIVRVINGESDSI